MKLGVNQDIDLYNLAGNSHLVVDLVGWYGPGTKTPLSLVIGHGLAPSAAELEPGRPLSALGDGAGPPIDFVTNELLLVGTNAAATKVAADWQGQVTSTTPSLAGLDPIHVIKFNLAAINPATLPTVLEALAILSEQAGGRRCRATGERRERARSCCACRPSCSTTAMSSAINVLTEPVGYQDGLILEEGFDENKDGLITGSESFNAFEFSYLREGGPMDHGFASAWQELDSYTRLRPAAKVAVFDGGFFDSDDLGPMTSGRHELRQFETRRLRGGNPCPWHGTGVAAHDLRHPRQQHRHRRRGDTGRFRVGRHRCRARTRHDSERPRHLAVQSLGTDVLNISAGGRIPAVLYAPLFLILAPIAAGSIGLASKSLHPLETTALMSTTKTASSCAGNLADGSRVSYPL